MFPTETTPFYIMNTPFHRDIVKEVLDAFRAEGIAPGLYFSPDDFWWSRLNSGTRSAHTPEVAPANNPGLLAHDRAQVKELLSGYGPVDVMFFTDRRRACGNWRGTSSRTWS